MRKTLQVSIDLIVQPRQQRLVLSALPSRETKRNGSRLFALLAAKSTMRGASQCRAKSTLDALHSFMKRRLLQKRDIAASFQIIHAPIDSRRDQGQSTHAILDPMAHDLLQSFCVCCYRAHIGLWLRRLLMDAHVACLVHKEL
jgi:hypothetical protein